MEISEYILKIGGMASMPSELNVGNDYRLILPVNCYSAEIRDDQGGKYEKVFRVKPTGEIIVENDLGKQIVAKSRNSQSKQLRSLIFYKFGELGIAGEFEDFYNSIMEKIRGNIDKIISM